jgi:hypothetical protein
VRAPLDTPAGRPLRQRRPFARRRCFCCSYVKELMV